VRLSSGEPAFAVAHLLLRIHDMNLSLGSAGSEVRQLQDSLNKLPVTNLTLLVADGISGPKTHARVLEFQRNNRLEADGIVGPPGQTRRGTGFYGDGFWRCHVNGK